MSTGTGHALAARPVTPLGILTAMLADLHEKFTAVPGLDPALLAGLGVAADLAAGLDPYVEACTTAESPALADLARRTREADWGRRGPVLPGAAPLEQEMLSGHVEGQLLKFLVHATRATRVLEIGMFTGYSALAMAEALPAGGVVLACEVDPFVAAFAQDCFAASPAGRAVDVRVAPAATTLAALAAAGEDFDLVFLDADKPGYLDYLTALLDGGLVTSAGLIVVDNTLMQGQPYTGGTVTANGTAIAEFNAAVAADPRVEQVLLPVRDGLTLIRRVA